MARNSPADPDDTLKVKKNLNKLGYMDIPSYGIDEMPDKPLFDGIKNFQKDNDLKVDGVMNPGGETEEKLDSKIKNGALVKPRNEVELPPPAYTIQPIAPKPPTDPNPNSTGNLADPGHIIDVQNPDDLQSIKDLAEQHGKPIKNSVGIGKANDPKDVLAISNLLNSFFQNQGEKTKTTSKATPDFKFDIQRFQKANDLKVDGVIKPKGETEEKIKEQVLKENKSAQESNESDATDCEKLKIEWQDVQDEWDELGRDMDDIYYRFGQLSDEARAKVLGIEAAGEAIDLVRKINGFSKNNKESFFSSLSSFLGKLNSVVFYDTLARDISGMIHDFGEIIDVFLDDLDFYYEEKDRVEKALRDNNCTK